MKAQKNDDRDAEAIAEPASRPTMRFVAVKSEKQLDLQSLHRVRSRLVNARKTLINQLRAILLERGHIIAQGPRRLDRALDELLADDDFAVSCRIRALVVEMRAEWQQLDERIDALNREFMDLVRAQEQARRLMTIPGVGVLNATALIAAVGDASAFRRGRDLAAWLGLVPRQFTTGGKPRLLGISKRGNNIYARCSFTVLGRCCHRWPRARHLSGGGCAGFWRAATAMSRSWRSPLSWHVSPGRACGRIRSLSRRTRLRPPDQHDCRLQGKRTVT
ncbi:MAG: IS110 family transposase [Mesorhizobium sp.]|nr:MAG: IS110 family transposase [Mesorhizobium sp.]